MSSHLLHSGFGLLVGLASGLWLPGHRPISMLLTGALSLVGAISGSLAAERLPPHLAQRTAGFALATLGALGMLLAYVLLVL